MLMNPTSKHIPDDVYEQLRPLQKQTEEASIVKPSCAWRRIAPLRTPISFAGRSGRERIAGPLFLPARCLAAKTSSAARTVG